MSGNHSRAGKPVERCIINDDPHERYQKIHPVTGERLNSGIPILNNAPNGKVVKKDVTYYKIICPDCVEVAQYTDDEEPICPNCGMVCMGDDAIPEEQLIRDAKAAGRIDNTGDGTPA